MKRLLVLALLVSLGLNIALAVRLWQPSAVGQEEAWEGRGHGWRSAPGDTQAWRERLDRRFERMARMLDLDPAQREAFRRHRAGVAGEVTARTAALAARRAELRMEAERRPTDPAGVAAALAAVGRAEAALDSLVAANLRHELELLRPDQQARFLRGMRFELLGGRHGPGDGPGHGPRRGRTGGRRSGRDGGTSGE